MRLGLGGYGRLAFGLLRARGEFMGMRLILWVRRLLLMLVRFVTPAELTLYDASLGQVRTQALSALVAFQVADRLVTIGPQKAIALARYAKAEPDRFTRLLNFAAAEGWLSRRGSFFVANRQTRRLARNSDQSLSHFVTYFASEATALAFTKLRQVVETGEHAYILAHGVGVWEYFHLHPTEGEVFDAAMIALTRLDADALAAAYPFSRHTCLYDIGGGRGQQLRAICMRYPRLRASVVDLPEVVARHAAATEERAFTYLTGNFFKTVPRGADCVLLRNILHDWDDEAALRILRNVRASVEEGGTLLIAEMLVEPDSAYPVGTMSDLTMLCATEGGRQRSRAGLEALLAASRWSFMRVWTFGKPTVLVEARAVA